MIRFLTDSVAKKYKGKTCLLRIDLNVEPGAPLDNYRLEAIMPTIKLLLRNEIKVVLLSHRGRPKSFDEKLSLKPFAKVIFRKIGEPVRFISYKESWLIDKMGFVAGHKERVFLLENLRFYKGEERNDKRLGEFLARWGNFYVNDAFAVSHRKNASVCAITKYLPSYAGLLLEKEIENLEGVMKDYWHPFTIIVGGAKISDKLGVLKYFWNKADKFLLGGGPANTLFAAQGLPIGESIADKDLAPKFKTITKSKKIVLPMDTLIKSNKILDIGPKTISVFSETIGKSRTVIWNGPPGLYEKKGFQKGTIALWKAVLSNRKAKIVVGGGETVASLKLLSTHYKLPNNVFLSTGGGAMLEYLSGKKLPGTEALK